jgi:hypothetical protein
MSTKTFSLPLAVLVAVAVASSTGCVADGPSLGLLALPIPVSPFFQKLKEDEFWIKERYDRVPILPPLTAGGPDTALDPPSDDEVMRTLERALPLQGGLPFLHDTTRNNVRIVKEKIADYVDPPRVYPLVGPAQLHHCHYKCTIYFTEITHVGWPLPHTLRDEDASEVVYIDHNHLHMVGNVEGGPLSNY